MSYDINKDAEEIAVKIFETSSVDYIKGILENSAAVRELEAAKNREAKLMEALNSIRELAIDIEQGHKEVTLEQLVTILKSKTQQALQETEDK